MENQVKVEVTAELLTERILGQVDRAFDEGESVVPVGCYNIVNGLIMSGKQVMAIYNGASTLKVVAFLNHLEAKQEGTVENIYRELNK